MRDAAEMRVPDTGGSGVPAAAEEEAGGVMWGEEGAALERVLPPARLESLFVLPNRWEASCAS